MLIGDETIETTWVWEWKVPLCLLILGLAILVIHGLATTQGDHRRAQIGRMARLSRKIQEFKFGTNVSIFRESSDCSDYSVDMR